MLSLFFSFLPVFPFSLKFFPIQVLPFWKTIQYQLLHRQRMVVRKIRIDNLQRMYIRFMLHWLFFILNIEAISLISNFRNSTCYIGQKVHDREWQQQVAEALTQEIYLMQSLTGCHRIGNSLVCEW